MCGNGLSAFFVAWYLSRRILISLPRVIPDPPAFFHSLSSSHFTELLSPPPYSLRFYQSTQLSSFPFMTATKGSFHIFPFTCYSVRFLAPFFLICVLACAASSEKKAVCPLINADDFRCLFLWSVMSRTNMSLRGRGQKVTLTPHKRTAYHQTLMFPSAFPTESFSRKEA
jgi:hypothetical protein